MELVDTHVHLDNPAYEHDIHDVLLRAEAVGVKSFICIGASDGIESNRKSLKISETFPNVFATVGIHPHDAGKFNFTDIIPLASHEKVVAIGETGLDFFKEYSPREEQEKSFIEHIELACSFKKPLIIHSRGDGCDEACLQVLKKHLTSDIRGVFHCYGGDFEFSKKLLELNFFISIPGIVTFKKASQAHEAAKSIPLSQILLETDGPYLSPEPYRGKRCESAFMIETAKKIALLKGLTLEEVAHQTTKNAHELFSGITSQTSHLL